MLYIKDKRGVDKNQVIHAILLGCIFLLQEFYLVCTSLIDATNNNIGGSIIHISLTIFVRNKHEKLSLVSFL